MSQRCFGERSRVSSNPISGVSAHPDSAFALKYQRFPCADGREKNLVLDILQRVSQVPATPVGIVLNPQPDVCTQQNLNRAAPPSLRDR